MRLQTFNAPTLDEAIAQVRESLGDDAVIVSTYQSRRGRGAQVTAALEDVRDDDALAHTVAHEEAGEPEDEIAQVLAFHRVAPQAARRLASRARTLSRDDVTLAIGAALDAELRFSNIPKTSERPIMFVGPPGAGKTVTTVKVAARAVLAGRRVQIVTTDTVRSGGYEQLDALATMMDVPLTSADTPEALSEVLAEMDECDLVLIDTPGTNAFAPAEVADLKAFADAANAKLILVLPAGGDSEDHAEAAQIFAALGAGTLHATKLDCARRFGNIVTAALAGGLNIAEASATAFIANGLSPVNSVSFARLMTETAFKVTELARREAVS